MGLAEKERKGGGGGSGSHSAGKAGDKTPGRRRRRRRSPFLPPPPPATDFFVVVSGPTCTPCAMFASFLSPDARARLPGAPAGIAGAWHGAVEAAATGGEEEEATSTSTSTSTTPTSTTPTSTTTVTLLHRFENDGMDFGAHNVTLEWVAFLERHERGGGGRGGGGGAAAAAAGGEEPEGARGGDGAPPASRHRRLIFLNSSARGPFLPAYLPEGWHWTDAFTRDLDEERDGEPSSEQERRGESESERGRRGSEGSGGGEEKRTRRKKVALVGAALACLPAVDAGGLGPRVESWAFALSQKGLALAKEAGVFGSHGCKLCADGVVVAGERERERGRERERKETESKMNKKLKKSSRDEKQKHDRGVRPLARRAPLRAQPRHADEPLREGHRLEPRGALGLQRQRASFPVSFFFSLLIFF